MLHDQFQGVNFSLWVILLEIILLLESWKLVYYIGDMWETLENQNHNFLSWASITLETYFQ